MATSVRSLVLAIALAQLAACGGGGGGGGNPPGPGRLPQSTTFIGNLNQPGSALELNGEPTEALALSAVQVCVEGTSFCAEVDATGAFTLAADVGGDIVLVFDGPSFTARLALSDVPAGATVRIEDIVCSITSGECHAANVDIVAAPNTPPDCSAAAADPAVLWPPDHEMVAIAIVGVVDPDGDPVVITATDVAQNEDEDDPGSGNTGPDTQLDPLAVRAERSGRGNGRIYTISFAADDGNGGTCDGTVEVCVPHDQGQGTRCG